MRILLLSLLALLVAVPAADAARKRDRLTNRQVARHPDLWATVNVCDTEASPNTIGIRASMLGDGRRLELFMRFRVHYLSRADGKWHTITDGADSGWRRVGLTRRGVRESGWSFTFVPPAAGGSQELRGAVTFEWRNRRRAVRRIREITEAGHRSSDGADPEGYSAATCTIR